MHKLTPESAVKLQRILSRCIGRELSQIELEQAYDALMGFAEALMELDESEAVYPQNPHKLNKDQQNQQNIRYIQNKQNIQKMKRTIANNNYL